MKLKVCGVRNTAMVQACQDALVDYIGLNFVPTSARVIDLEKAQFLSHAFTGKKVGVFMNQSIEEILNIASVVDLDIIQLHGEESPEFIKALKGASSHLVWKAFSIDEKFKNTDLQYYVKNCESLLFDGKTPGSGSQIVDTEKLKSAITEAQRLGIKVGLAGGINTKTIPNLLKEFSHVDFLDTASGVEESGKFSRSNLTQLCNLLLNE